jgi:hypothetical protein
MIGFNPIRILTDREEWRNPKIERSGYRVVGKRMSGEPGIPTRAGFARDGVEARLARRAAL